VSRSCDSYRYEQDADLYDLSDRNHQGLKLYEERLLADKKRQKTGEVTISKHVETETARATILVEKERVVIERVSIMDGHRCKLKRHLLPLAPIVLNIQLLADSQKSAPRSPLVPLHPRGLRSLTTELRVRLNPVHLAKHKVQTMPLGALGTRQRVDQPSLVPLGLYPTHKQHWIEGLDRSLTRAYPGLPQQNQDRKRSMFFPRHLSGRLQQCEFEPFQNLRFGFLPCSHTKIIVEVERD
jgi:hypothetical protein